MLEPSLMRCNFGNNLIAYIKTNDDYREGSKNSRFKPTYAFSFSEKLFRGELNESCFQKIM